MNDKQLVGPWVRRFLLEHQVAERNFSGNTQASYRDTLTLLLPFASAHVGHAIDRMTVEDLTPSIVRQFLDHLERDRRCSGATRNQRLAMIHSLARFIGTHSPAHLAWCSELRSIPFKKTAKTSIGYLEKREIDALLNQPDQRTALGARDHTLLLFLYNSGQSAVCRRPWSATTSRLASPSLRATNPASTAAIKNLPLITALLCCRRGSKSRATRRAFHTAPHSDYCAVIRSSRAGCGRRPPWPLMIFRLGGMSQSPRRRRSE